MREFKFRAFDDGKMINMPLNSNFGISRFFGILGEDAVIMQYTGRKDEFGKDIYEGDIVLGTKKDIKCIVSYNDHNGGFYSVDSKNSLIGYTLMIPEGEFGGGNLICPFQVIGNIYENPNLLNP